MAALEISSRVDDVSYVEDKIREVYGLTKDNLKNAKEEFAQKVDMTVIKWVLEKWRDALKGKKQQDFYDEYATFWAGLILAVQIALGSIDPAFKTEYDGIYGGKDGATFTMVKAFQEKWNKEHPNDQIAVDGWAGTDTITRILSYPIISTNSSPTPTQNPTPPTNTWPTGSTWGATGPTGNTWPTGVSWATGPTGASGQGWVTGSTWNTGPTWSSGATWASGNLDWQKTPETATDIQDYKILVWPASTNSPEQAKTLKLNKLWRDRFDVLLQASPNKVLWDVVAGGKSVEHFTSDNTGNLTVSPVFRKEFVERFGIDNTLKLWPIHIQDLSDYPNSITLKNVKYSNKELVPDAPTAPIVPEQTETLPTKWEVEIGARKIPIFDDKELITIQNGLSDASKAGAPFWDALMKI